MNCPICGAAHTACGGETPAPQFIITMEEIPIMAAYVADRRLYLDKDGKVVEEGDPNKVSLLVGAGGTIPEERARALGLLDEKKVEEKAKSEPVEEKAKPEPTENKARGSAPENKAKA